MKSFLEELKIVNCPYLGKGKYEAEGLRALLGKLQEVLIILYIYICI